MVYIWRQTSAAAKASIRTSQQDIATVNPSKYGKGLAHVGVEGGTCNQEAWFWLQLME